MSSDIDFIRLLMQLDAPNPNDRQAACRALGDLPVSSIAVVKALSRAAASDASPGVRWAAYAALLSPAHEVIQAERRRQQRMGEATSRWLAAQISDWETNGYITSAAARVIRHQYFRPSPQPAPTPTPQPAAPQVPHPAPSTSPAVVATTTPEAAAAIATTATEPATPLAAAPPPAQAVPVVAAPAPTPRPAARPAPPPATPRKPTSLADILFSELTIRIFLGLGLFFVIAAAATLATLVGPARLPVLGLATLSFYGASLVVGRRQPIAGYTFHLGLTLLFLFTSVVALDPLRFFGLVNGINDSLYLSVMALLLAGVALHGVVLYRSYFFAGLAPLLVTFALISAWAWWIGVTGIIPPRGDLYLTLSLVNLGTLAIALFFAQRGEGRILWAAGGVALAQQAVVLLPLFTTTFLGFEYLPIEFPFRWVALSYPLTERDWVTLVASWMVVGLVFFTAEQLLPAWRRTTTTENQLAPNPRPGPIGLALRALTVAATLPIPIIALRTIPSDNPDVRVLWLVAAGWSVITGLLSEGLRGPRQPIRNSYSALFLLGSLLLAALGGFGSLSTGHTALGIAILTLTGTLFVWLSARAPRRRLFIWAVALSIFVTAYFATFTLPAIAALNITLIAQFAGLAALTLVAEWAVWRLGLRDPGNWQAPLLAYQLIALGYTLFVGFGVMLYTTVTFDAAQHTQALLSVLGIGALLTTLFPLLDTRPTAAMRLRIGLAFYVIGLLLTATAAPAVAALWTLLAAGAMAVWLTVLSVRRFQQDIWIAALIATLIAYSAFALLPAIRALAIAPALWLAIPAVAYLLLELALHRLARASFGWRAPALLFASLTGGLYLLWLLFSFDTIVGLTNAILSLFQLPLQVTTSILDEVGLSPALVSATARIKVLVITPISAALLLIFSLLDDRPTADVRVAALLPFFALAIVFSWAVAPELALLIAGVVASLFFVRSLLRFRHWLWIAALLSAVVAYVAAYTLPGIVAMQFDLRFLLALPALVCLLADLLSWRWLRASLNWRLPLLAFAVPFVAYIALYFFVRPEFLVGLGQILFEQVRATFVDPFTPAMSQLTALMQVNAANALLITLFVGLPFTVLTLLFDARTTEGDPQSLHHWLYRWLNPALLWAGILLLAFAAVYAWAVSPLWAAIVPLSIGAVLLTLAFLRRADTIHLWTLWPVALGFLALGLLGLFSLPALTVFGTRIHLAARLTIIALAALVTELLLARNRVTAPAWRWPLWSLAALFGAFTAVLLLLPFELRHGLSRFLFEQIRATAIPIGLLQFSTATELALQFHAASYLTTALLAGIPLVVLGTQFDTRPTRHVVTGVGVGFLLLALTYVWAAAPELARVVPQAAEPTLIVLVSAALATLLTTLAALRRHPLTISLLWPTALVAFVNLYLALFSLPGLQSPDGIAVYTGIRFALLGLGVVAAEVSLARWTTLARHWRTPLIVLAALASLIAMGIATLDHPLLIEAAFSALFDRLIAGQAPDTLAATDLRTPLIITKTVTLGLLTAAAALIYALDRRVLQFTSPATDDTAFAPLPYRTLALYLATPLVAAFAILLGLRLPIAAALTLLGGAVWLALASRRPVQPVLWLTALFMTLLAFLYAVGPRPAHWHPVHLALFAVAAYTLHMRFAHRAAPASWRLPPLLAGALTGGWAVLLTTQYALATLLFSPFGLPGDPFGRYLTAALTYTLLGGLALLYPLLLARQWPGYLGALLLTLGGWWLGLALNQVITPGFSLSIRTLLAVALYGIALALSAVGLNDRAPVFRRSAIILSALLALAGLFYAGLYYEVLPWRGFSRPVPLTMTIEAIIAASLAFVLYAIHGVIRRNVWYGYPANLFLFIAYSIAIARLQVVQPQYYSTAAALMGLLMHYLLTRAKHRLPAYLTGLISMLLMLSVPLFQLVFGGSLWFFWAVFFQSLAVIAYGLVARSRTLTFAPVIYVIIATAYTSVVLLGGWTFVIIVGITGIALLGLGTLALLFRQQVFAVGQKVLKELSAWEP